MLIGLVGKPSCGKSSFFKAATMIDVKIASYPFTTIEPNHGIGYVTAECPCKSLEKKCNPQNSQCINGTRLIPVELLDVAGLVPGSHKGRGRGNKFLNDLIRGHALIHIIDASGRTDAEGVETTDHNPSEDVKFLEEEIDLWFENVIKKNIEKIRDKQKAAEVLGGIGINPKQAEDAINSAGLEPAKLAKELRRVSKPIIIAANKMDIPGSSVNLEKMKKDFPNLKIVPCCAEAEIALRGAAKQNLIKYTPGENNFEEIKEMSDEQKKGLEFIHSFLKENSSTGVQDCLNSAVFDLLDYITVYPVENENKLSDKKGNILPDAHLVPKGTTAKELAFRIHTDIGKAFIGAIDARTKKRIGADHVLENGDIIKIQSAAK